MKRLFVLILLAFIVCGCGDEGIENVLDPQSVPGAPAQGDVVTKIPPLTSKHPEIREKLFPRNSGFRMILTPSTAAYWELPENLFRRNPKRVIGSCVGAQLN